MAATKKEPRCNLVPERETWNSYGKDRYVHKKYQEKKRKEASQNKQNRNVIIERILGLPEQTKHVYLKNA